LRNRLNATPLELDSGISQRGESLGSKFVVERSKLGLSAVDVMEPHLRYAVARLF
jgi:hypothetical protein